MIETIILSRRKELALRETSESGPLTLDQPMHNDEVKFLKKLKVLKVSVQKIYNQKKSCV